MSYAAIIYASLAIGATIGFLTACLCSIAREADREQHPH